MLKNLLKIGAIVVGIFAIKEILDDNRSLDESEEMQLWFVEDQLVGWDKDYHNVSDYDMNGAKELLSILQTKTNDPTELSQIADLQQYIENRKPIR